MEHNPQYQDLFDAARRLTHAIAQLDRQPPQASALSDDDARTATKAAQDLVRHWQGVADAQRAELDTYRRECANAILDRSAADYRIGVLTGERDELSRQLKEARAVLSDLLTGAEQMSQSHADVASRCRDALARVSSTEQKEETQPRVQTPEQVAAWEQERKHQKMAGIQ